MLDESYYQVADEIIGRYGKKPSSLIPIMQDIQEAYRYLPGELLSYVAGADRSEGSEGIQRSDISMRTFRLRRKESM